MSPLNISIDYRGRAPYDPPKDKNAKKQKNIKIKDYWEGKISQYKKEKRPFITPGKQKRKDR